MKILIWILCFLANGVVTSILGGMGVSLGAIPTGFLTFATLSSAFFLCRKWDEHRIINKVQNNNSIIENQDSSNDKIKFCRKCGFELIDDSEFCSQCGTEIVILEQPTLKKCEMCDKETTQLSYCEIKDEYGTRYRNVCAECRDKYEAKEIKG